MAEDTLCFPQATGVISSWIMLAWDAFCSYCFLNNLLYRSPKEIFL